MTTLVSVTATDPKEVAQEATNAITMPTVLMEKRTMNVLAMMITLEMDSHAQVRTRSKCNSKYTRPPLFACLY